MSEKQDMEQNIPSTKTSSDDLYESMLSAARGLKKLGISTEECADKLYEGTTALHKLSTQKYIFL